MKEKTQHRLAFDQYVRMGASRSLEALHELLRDDPSLIELPRAPSRSTLDVWSSSFLWQDRLLDLEREAAERDREEQIEAIRRMNDRHAREGVALQQKGMERLSSLDADELSSSDATRAVKEGVLLERLARGAPTEHIRKEEEKAHGHIDLTRFTNEELRRLAERADRRATGAGKEESE